MNTNQLNKLQGISLAFKGGFAQPAQPVVDIGVKPDIDFFRPDAGELRFSAMNFPTPQLAMEVQPITAPSPMNFIREIGKLVEEAGAFSQSAGSFTSGGYYDYDYDYGMTRATPQNVHTYEPTRELVMVQEVREDAQEAIMELLMEFEGYDPTEYRGWIKFTHWLNETKKYPLLGSGHFSRVYDVAGYAVKINNPDLIDEYGGIKDGKILHDLLGAPCVPQVYAYSENSEIVIMEKVSGVVMLDVDSQAKGLPFYNHERETQRLEQTRQRLIERGYRFQDCHWENTMLSDSGHFYVIDVGLFHTTEWGTEEHCYEKCSRHLRRLENTKSKKEAV